MKRLSILCATVIFCASFGICSHAKEIEIGGDFRYRHEMIKTEDDNARHRNRIRARLNLEGTVNNSLKVLLGISSGSSDPVSNNQTLTGAFASKALLIDLAYFDYKPESIPGLNAIAGKFKNPFYFPGKSELIWDSDIRPEGVALGYSTDLSSIKLNLNAAGLWIEERSSSDDTYLIGSQALIDYQVCEDGCQIGGGVSYFHYDNMENYPLLYDSEDSYGNSAKTVNGDEELLYNTEYHLLEAFGTFKYQIGEVPFEIIGDFVTNLAADSVEAGWLIGIYFNKIKETGDWDFRYLYRELKKDAVVGLFADSDFRGGGTDARGHEIGVNYQLMGKTTFAVTYFYNQIGLENSVDFQKLQVDLKMKF